MLGGIVDERERERGDSLRRVFKGNDMEDSGKGVKKKRERERKGELRNP